MELTCRIRTRYGLGFHFAKWGLYLKLLVGLPVYPCEVEELVRHHVRIEVVDV